MTDYRWHAVIYDFGHDAVGARTAHFQLFDHGVLVAESGAERVRCGPDESRAAGAVDALEERVGGVFDALVVAGAEELGWVRVALARRKKR